MPQWAFQLSTREIVDLVYYHEKSVEEVAEEIVGDPGSDSKMTRMFYARKKLAELFESSGSNRGTRFGHE